MIEPPTGQIEKLFNTYLEQIRQIALLADPVEFEAEYRRQCQECGTYEEAYHKTEEKYSWLFGEPKYSTYVSFRMVIFRRRKRREEKASNN